jgi:hypothetical protein
MASHKLDASSESNKAAEDDSKHTQGCFPRPVSIFLEGFLWCIQLTYAFGVPH